MPEQKHVGAEGPTPMSPERRMEMRRQLFAAYGADFPTAMERKQAPRLLFADVSVARLLAGLAAAGVGSSVTLIDSVFTDAHRMPYWSIAAVLLGSELLWMIPGAACVLAICWMRGFVRRLDCLALGAGLAMLSAVCRCAGS